jgi:hypothetical protein
MIILQKVGGRELPRQFNETEQQIWKRRATLICLDIYDYWENQPRVLCVMPYMTDL